MHDLPQIFLSRMRDLLGEEFPAFLASYIRPAEIGLRINPSKIHPSAFIEKSPFEIEPIPWTGLGFRIRSALDDKVKPGKHPFHAAGLYYLQEPSAMLAAEVLSPRPGERVLDLCAAPGGKATHLASLLAGDGVLIANDIHPKRVWKLAENLERWGVRNAIVLNETPERLADHFGVFFDKILIDAHCSGEGLFRKEDLARQIWTPEMQDGCAIRQLKILEAAARMLKSGGRMVYSTCTFNAQENETVIARFLKRHPEFELIDPGNIPGTSRSRPEWVLDDTAAKLVRALRIWPHHAPGEGHFVALLEKQADEKLPSLRPFDRKAAPISVIMQLKDLITATIPGWQFDLDIHQERSYLYLIPKGSPDLEGLRVIHPGWWIGTLKKDRVEPSHALAMGLNSEDVSEYLDIPLEDNESIAAYLRGENLSGKIATEHPVRKGWVLITVEGYSLGWGRRVGELIKNCYPRGLRRSF